MKPSSSLQAFIDSSVDQRLQTLSLMDSHRRVRLFEEWADHCSVTDVVDLFEHDKGAFFEMERAPCGHTKTNRKPVNRMFIVGPNPDYTPRPDLHSDDFPFVARLELGTVRSVRKFMTIPVPQYLPPHLALKALLQYGESAEITRLRGALKEYTEDEFLNWKNNNRKEEEALVFEQSETNRKNKGR